jgi:hypothetical protein
MGTGSMQKRLLFVAMGAAGLMALFSITDFILKFPFGGRMELDIPFLIAAGIILYMSWETYRELS